MNGKHWIDNADSWICPVCRFECDNPAKYDGCKCPKCGFQDEKDRKEKQIEEMACAMCGQDKICGGVGVEKCIIYPGYRRQANRLYNAGYRKQSEGEWIPTFTYTSDGTGIYKCSLCGRKSANPKSDKFCPNCGAKMKGE